MTDFFKVFGVIDRFDPCFVIYEAFSRAPLRSFTGHPALYEKIIEIKSQRKRLKMTKRTGTESRKLGFNQNAYTERTFS